MTSRARLRERAVLDAQVIALREVDPVGEFERGALAALHWLLEGGSGPLTGEVGARPTATRAIVQELAAAEAIIYGARSERAGYAQGVEHALMWAQFATCTTPAPDVRGQRGHNAAQPGRPRSDGSGDSG